MAGKPKFTPEQMIRAIEETKGLITLTARKLGCTAETVRGYARRYASVRKALEEEREKTLDVAELALFSQVQAGE